MILSNNTIPFWIWIFSCPPYIFLECTNSLGVHIDYIGTLIENIGGPCIINCSNNYLTVFILYSNYIMGAQLKNGNDPGE